MKITKILTIFSFFYLCMTSANSFADDLYPIDIKYQKCIEQSKGLSSSIISCANEYLSHWNNEINKYQSLAKRACKNDDLNGDKCYTSLDRTLKGFEYVNDGVPSLYIISGGSIGDVIAAEEKAIIARKLALTLKQFVTMMGEE